MRFAELATAALALSLFCLGCARDSTPHGGTTRASVSDASGLAAIGSLAWKSELGLTQPLVAQGDHAFVVRKATVARLLDDGTADEPVELGETPSSAMTVVSGVGYYGAGKSVAASRFPDGGLVWATKVDEAVSASPLVAGGTVFAAAGSLVALDASSGSESWRYTGEGKIRGAPALLGDEVYVASTNGVVYAIDAATGQPRWELATGSDFGAVPVAVTAEMVVVGGRDGVVWGIFRATGRERWRLPTRGVIATGVAVRDDLAWIGTENGDVSAINLRSGQETWRMTGLPAIVTAPVWAGGRVHVGCDDGKFVALGGEDGKHVWSFQLESEPLGPPVFGNGFIVLADRAGRVYRLE